jgi:hypothetical protein
MTSPNWADFAETLTKLSAGSTAPSAPADPAALLNRELADQRARREARRILDAEERPAVREPETLTLRERLARPRPPVLFRIEGWQPVGSRVVLAAQFKAGKTTATGNSARSLVDGDPWLGQFKVEPIDGTLVIADVEMSEAQLDGWLGDQRIVNDDRVIPIPLKGNAAAFDILDPARRAEWAALLRRVRCAYFALDCLRPVLDALGLDEHRDAGRFLVALDTLLAEAGVPEALVVHHMGHAGERSRGDSRIRDWPDVEWRLVRQDEEPSSPRFISAYGRDVDVPESQLSYDRATRHLTMVGGSRKDAAVLAALDDVLAALATESRQSGRRLEELLADGDHTRACVRAAIKEGIRTGQIQAEPGPRRSTLHSLCASAPSAPSVRLAKSSECASALIEGALHSDNGNGEVRQSKWVACKTCGQPLMHPESIARGVCARCVGDPETPAALAAASTTAREENDHVES